VATIVSGHFLKAGDQVQITLNLTDVEANRLIWTDVFNAPVGDMMAMQAQIASKTRRAMAPLLGVSEFVTDQPPRPRDEEAYQLYLRATALGEDMSTNSVRQQRIDMLNKSLAHDPSYAPAWEALAVSYQDESVFGSGSAAAIARAYTVNRKAFALDPDNIVFRAGSLYYFGTFGRRVAGQGGISRGEAYREMEDLIRRRPDNARLYFLASWILRDVGLLDESARECDRSVLIDAQDAGARSCGVTFMLRGDYRRALDYLDLDPDSEVSKAVRIDVLVRQGKASEALQRANGDVPPWGAYAVLIAALEHRPAPEIAALARQIQPSSDPEINFFSAAHLAYAQQTGPAVAMLRQTIEGGYCSYPAIDSDPFFASLRATPEFQQIRLAGQRCQNDFIAQRLQTKR
jgi:tetratricopeptide (TPR) repeat protein